MNELVKVDPKEYGLEENKAKEITTGLNIILEERKLLIDEFNDVSKLEITEENIPLFKELRLKIRNNRTKGIEPWHKVNKEFFLTGGRFVDAIKNKEILENQQMESKLMEAEKHFENLEKERVEKLTTERVEACTPYVEDESLILPDLGAMPQNLWDNYIIGLKASYEAKIAAEKKAEEERIAAEKAEVERQKAIEEENAALKAEAEANAKQQEEERKERERLAKIEADKQAKIEAERKEKERKEKEAYEAETKRLRLEAEAKLKAEREEKERIQKELEDKAEAERLAAEEAKKAEQAELNKGDKAKVQDLINDLNKLKEKYTFKSEKNKAMYGRVGILINKTVDYINK